MGTKWHIKWANSCPPLNRESLWTKETLAIFNKSLWSDILNIPCLEFMADKAFLNYITLQTFNFSKSMQEPASSGSLLIRKGSSADSRLLVGAHGRPNHDLWVLGSRAPASASTHSGLLFSLSWAGADLASAGSLPNPGKGANTFRAQVVDTWAYLWKRYSHANFNSFKRKDEIIWTLAKNI